ncbi:MAG TPA: MmgE/PrpD family protein [Acidimicrobiales bacterium]|nr:MmgE/PrpD family protein [Acidimicrobiales bacterium]
MTTRTQELADFVSGTTYDDLPSEVVDYTKLIILDCLACGIAGGGEPRSRMMHDVVRRLGGPADATVFGLGGRVASANAAMANAEIMNLLDADDTFFNASHFAAMSVAAALAEGQRTGASGRDLIRAVAVGFDVSARVNLAILVVAEEDGEARWAPIQGMGFATFGAAASAAAVGGLPAAATRNAFGLAAWMAPTPKAYDMATRREFGTMKYVNNASVAGAGVLAATCAEMGYVADQDVLDTDPGFIRSQGQAGADPALLTEDLGTRWWVLDSAVKYYPACRFACGPIDAVTRLVGDAVLSAGDVERIEIGLNPWAYAIRFFRQPPRLIAGDHRAPLHGAFHLPYVVALAALGRTPGPQWYWPENLDDPAVWALADRVTTVPDRSLMTELTPSAEEVRVRRFRRTRGRMAVRAGGADHEVQWDYCRGDPWTEATRPTAATVGRKLHDFCDRMVDPDVLDALADQVLRLEDVDDVGRQLGRGLAGWAA